MNQLINIRNRSILTTYKIDVIVKLILKMYKIFIPISVLAFYPMNTTTVIVELYNNADSFEECLEKVKGVMTIVCVKLGSNRYVIRTSKNDKVHPFTIEMYWKTASQRNKWDVSQIFRMIMTELSEALPTAKYY